MLRVYVSGLLHIARAMQCVVTSQCRPYLHCLEHTSAAFDKDAVKMAAAKVASVSGDVRRALHLCRRAAELASAEAMHIAAIATKVPSQQRALVVRIEDINAAAKVLNTGLHIEAIASTSPWQRQLLVALAAYLRSADSDDAPALSIYERAISYSRLMSTVAASTATSSTCSPSAGMHAEDKATELLEGYCLVPTVDDMACIASYLDAKRLLVIDHVAASRWPRLRLNVQLDDVTFALRDDPLVQRVLIE